MEGSKPDDLYVLLQFSINNPIQANNFQKKANQQVLLSK